MTKMSFEDWWVLVKKSGLAWIDDHAPSMGAALSYYTVFSLAPMLLIVVAVVGLVFGQDAARGALYGQLSGMMGAEGAKAVEGLLTSVSKPTDGILATVTGVVVLLVGATTVFGELQDSLDRVWRSPAEEKGGGLWGMLRTRFLSFGMILGIGFLLMVSLVLSAGVAALAKWWSPIFGGWEILAQVVTFMFGLVVTTVAFAMIYKLMPRARVRWHDVWIGAAVTSLLFSLGRFLIGLYIGWSGVASGFGAAGSLVIVFVWVYYSAQIFLLGAEFTWVYATTLGSMKEVQRKGDALASTPVPIHVCATTNAYTGLPPRVERLPATAMQSPTTLGLAGTVLLGLAFRYVLPMLLRGLARTRTRMNASAWLRL